jgi:hypothetical protein
MALPELCIPSPARLAQAAWHRQGWPPQTGVARHSDDREGQTKRYQRRLLVEVIRRVVLGCEAEEISRVIGTQRSIRALINTAYIRAAKRHLESQAGPFGWPDSRRGAQTGNTTGGGGVLGGWLLELGVGALHSRGGAYPGDGGADDGSSLVDGGALLRHPVPPAELPKWRGRKPRWLLEAERAA